MYKPGTETVNIRIDLPIDVVDFLRDSNPNVPVPQMAAAMVCDMVLRLVGQKPEDGP